LHSWKRAPLQGTLHKMPRACQSNVYPRCFFFVARMLRIILYFHGFQSVSSPIKRQTYRYIYIYIRSRSTWRASGRFIRVFMAILTKREREIERDARSYRYKSACGRFSEMYRGFTRSLTWIHRGPWSMLFSITSISIDIRVRGTNRCCNNSGGQDATVRSDANTESRFSKAVRFDDGKRCFWCLRRFNWNFNFRPPNRTPCRWSRSSIERFGICVFSQSEISDSLSCVRACVVHGNLSCEKTRYRQILADQANEGPRVNHSFVTLWSRHHKWTTYSYK